MPEGWQRKFTMGRSECQLSAAWPALSWRLLLLQKDPETGLRGSP